MRLKLPVFVPRAKAAEKKPAIWIQIWARTIVGRFSDWACRKFAAEFCESLDAILSACAEGFKNDS